MTLECSWAEPCEIVGFIGHTRLITLNAIELTIRDFFCFSNLTLCFIYYFKQCSDADNFESILEVSVMK